MDNPTTLYGPLYQSMDSPRERTVKRQQPRLMDAALGRDDRGTPQWLFDELNKEFGFTLDAAASPHNAKCSAFLCADDNALTKSWDGVVYCNPPYGGEIGVWVAKAASESVRGSTVVMLLPASTDTHWFHDYCVGREIRFIKGRIQFQGTKHKAPFPSMIVVFRPETGRA